MKKILYLLIALRPSQWIKNFFIFLPLIFGRQLFVFPSNSNAFVTFILFCMISSASYLVNDLIDLKEDRCHPVKRLRPLAAGKISPGFALSIAFILSATTFFVAFTFNTRICGIIILYFIFNLLYSKILKELVIIDVFCLGGFFFLRIAAGTIAAQVDYSYWMVFMAILLALFLGFNKRRQELKLLERKISTEHRPVLLKYNTYFIDQIIAVITPSITIAYMLYTVDIRTVNFFGTHYLVFSVPFVYYGIFRYLYLIHKVGRSGDPTHILIQDTMLQLDILLWLSTCILIIYFK